MRRVGIVAKPDAPRAPEVVTSLVDWLTQRRIEVILEKETAGIVPAVRATADEVTLTIAVRHAFYAELRALARAQGMEPAQLIANAIGPRAAAATPIPLHPGAADYYRARQLLPE